MQCPRAPRQQGPGVERDARRPDCGGQVTDAGVVAHIERPRGQRTGKGQQWRFPEHDGFRTDRGQKAEAASGVGPDPSARRRPALSRVGGRAVTAAKPWTGHRFATLPAPDAGGMIWPHAIPARGAGSACRPAISAASGTWNARRPAVEGRAHQCDRMLPDRKVALRRGEPPRPPARWRACCPRRADRATQTSTPRDRPARDLPDPRGARLRGEQRAETHRLEVDGPIDQAERRQQVSESGLRGEHERPAPALRPQRTQRGNGQQHVPQRSGMNGERVTRLDLGRGRQPAIGGSATARGGVRRAASCSAHWWPAPSRCRSWLARPGP